VVLENYCTALGDSVSKDHECLPSSFDTQITACMHLVKHLVIVQGNSKEREVGYIYGHDDGNQMRKGTCLQRSHRKDEVERIHRRPSMQTTICTENSLSFARGKCCLERCGKE
jgi:hypothetical protein